jgi:hypothetical protein
MPRAAIVPAPPLTGNCSVCKLRVKVRKDGMLWRHQRRQREPYCPGSGEPPLAGTVKKRWPHRSRKSVTTVSGGAVESDRRRH